MNASAFMCRMFKRNKINFLHAKRKLKRIQHLKIEGNFFESHVSSEYEFNSDEIVLTHFLRHDRATNKFIGQVLGLVNIVFHLQNVEYFYFIHILYLL